MTAPLHTPDITKRQPDSIKATVSEGTEYVVLSRIDGGKWEELTGRITARGNEAAVRAYLDATKESPNNTVEYVAVPVRSWTPLKVRVQTVTTLKLEEAK